MEYLLLSINCFRKLCYVWNHFGAKYNYQPYSVIYLSKLPDCTGIHKQLFVTKVIHELARYLKYWIILLKRALSFRRLLWINAKRLITYKTRR